MYLSFPLPPPLPLFLQSVGSLKKTREEGKLRAIAIRGLQKMYRTSSIRLLIVLAAVFLAVVSAKELKDMTTEELEAELASRRGGGGRNILSSGGSGGRGGGAPPASGDDD